MARPVTSEPALRTNRISDAAIHEEVASGDESTLRSQEQRRDIPHIVRGAGPLCRAAVDHAPLARAARPCQLVLRKRRHNDARANGVDARAALAPADRRGRVGRGLSDRGGYFESRGSTRRPCCAVSVSSCLWRLSRAEATTKTGVGGYLDRGARRTRAMSQKGAGRTDRLRQEHNSKKAGLYGSRNATARMKPAEPFSML